ncbi:MAG: GNAT family N-acetyltransferase [Clostridia bacterium]|nr:GNAT family N-acetyltransferase [Clostridia bacterium]
MYRIHETDIAEIGLVLGDAFEHDPIWEYILEGKTREQRGAWFQAPARYCFKYGGAYAPSPNIEGFIGYLPAEFSEMTFKRMLRAGTMRGTRKAGMQPVLRMSPLRIFDEYRKKHMKGKDFIYVMIVGIDPKLQRQGFGGKLIRHVISESDKSGLPIYLETSTENNVSMYEHLGFNVIDKIMLPKLNLPQWVLLREPDHSK